LDLQQQVTQVQRLPTQLEQQVVRLCLFIQQHRLVHTLERALHLLQSQVYQTELHIRLLSLQQTLMEPLQRHLRLTPQHLLLLLYQALSTLLLQVVVRDQVMVAVVEVLVVIRLQHLAYQQELHTL
jgi:hypothetical protein